MSPADCSWFYLTDRRNAVGDFHTIHGSNFGDVGGVERYELMANWFVNKLKENDVKYVALEGYALNSPNPVTLTTLAENIGILKLELHNAGIEVEIIAPTALKKCATGKGNANKEKMYEAFLKDTDLDLHDLLNIKSTKAISPISDIVDAYYLALSCRTYAAIQEYEYKNGIAYTGEEI